MTSAMIIYNVTCKIDHDYAAVWLDWMKKEHIPDLISTGCFDNARIMHLLEADDEHGITYAIQYEAKDLQHYEKYITEFSEEMRNRAKEKWGDHLVSFRTLMQLVN